MSCSPVDKGRAYLTLVCPVCKYGSVAWSPYTKKYTVEPVYNGPVLSGHPQLSGQFSKSRLFAHTNAVFVTCIRRPPLLSGRGHPVAVLCLSFFVIFTCIKRSPLNGNLPICYFMRYFIVFKMRSIITIKK